ncbi:MAG TPA: response regulator [Kofleriaceae bacterium]|nr:response regulator [Kofleriaceae bacterium]
MFLERRRSAIKRTPVVPKQTVAPVGLRSQRTSPALEQDSGVAPAAIDPDRVNACALESEASYLDPGPPRHDADAARRRRNTKTNEPASGNAWAALTDRSADRPLAGRRSLHTILVVDDNVEILGLWERMARGRKVITANDAITARRLTGTEPPDLAIIDLRLGSTSGIALIRELKRDLPDLQVVLCSGYLSVPIAMAAMRAGADSVVVKPITPREILWQVEASAEEPAPEDTPTLAHAEYEHIMRVLADCNGNVSMAARRLGIYRSSLQRALQRLGK